MKGSFLARQNSARTAYLVRQLQLATQSRLEERLRPFDLTPSEFTVLGILEGRDRLSAAQLARRLAITPQSMNELITSLERKQLVMREAVPTNRRILEARLTAAGRRLVALADEVMDKIETEVYRGLGRAERSTFHRLLAKTLAKLHEDTGEAPDARASGVRG